MGILGLGVCGTGFRVAGFRGLRVPTHKIKDVLTLMVLGLGLRA